MFIVNVVGQSGQAGPPCLLLMSSVSLAKQAHLVYY